MSLNLSQFQSGFQDVISKLDEVGTTVQSAVSTLFKKDLHDLVSGIRANKGNESKYINDCIQEIKEELKSFEHDEKAMAVLKLTYLQMLGYNMDWASFRVIEVISHPEFSHKRIGYLAASQSFSESTDVMVLITNMIRKDCLSPNLYDGGIALNCLANICTTELARDLVPDIVIMLSSGRPYIRKKAVLVMYKIFVKFPDALRPSFPRLKERLSDPDTAVVSAAVNVICELAKKNARNYLPLAPVLFELLTKSNNNWMLIKVIKLFAILIPLEERLRKKLAEPLCNIINSTNSMSLMYEAIYTCIVGLSSYRNVMQLCSSKLRMFIEHPDQNLKYLGLLALSKIMEVFPKGIMEHRDLILNCLEDEDQSIRLRAVELLTGMVDRKNLAFIVEKLRHYLDTADGLYRDELLEKIIYICSQDKYKFITDFEWYMGVLIDLTHVKGVKNGSIVSQQILDVCVRVKLVRPTAVKQMLELLQDKVLLTEDVKAGSMCEALYAAAWVVGEYADMCKEHLTAIDTLTQPDVSGLPAHIQSIYIHNALKVFSAMCSVGTTPEDPLPKHPELDNTITLIKNRLPTFTASTHIEVQERASFFEQLVKIFEEQRSLGVNIAEELAVVTADALNPVSAQAQLRVPKPEGLDLDAWIHEQMPEEEEELFGDKKPGLSWPSEDEETTTRTSQRGPYSTGNTFNEMVTPSYDAPTTPYRPFDQKQVERDKELYAESVKNNWRYIKGDDTNPSEQPPLRKLESDFPAIREEIAPRPKGVKAPRSYVQPISIITEEENPPEYKPGDPEPKKVPINAPKDALASVDLTGEINESIPIADDSRIHSCYRPLTKNPSSPEKPVAAARGRRGGRGRTGPAGRRGGRTGRRGRGERGGNAPVPKLQPTTTENSTPKENDKPPVEKPRKISYNRAAAPKRPNPLRIIPLCKDLNIEISYELLSSRAQKNRLLAVFYVKNLTQEIIEKAQFTFSSTANFQVAPHPTKKRQATDPIPLDSLVPASSSVVFKLPFQYETFTQPQSLTGKFDYSQGSIEFTLQFPCSAFILPEEIGLEAFLNIMHNDALISQPTPLNTTLQKATARICGIFRVKVVEEDDKKVSMYGKTVLEHPVAFLIKLVGGPEELGVQIRSNNEELTTSLLQELQDLKW